jgi:DNA polymerase-1
MKTVVFDIETNGLNPDKIWFIVCRTIEEGNTHVFTGPALDGWLTFSRSVDCWVGHNIIGYDVPVLDRLVGSWRKPDSQLVDTLVISRLLDADIDGGHSIEAWGRRLGIEKKHSGIEDWSKPTPEMLERCVSDTDVNVALYKKFKKYVDSPVWKSSIEVEHFIAERCWELNQNGFHFCIDKARTLWYNLDEQLRVLDEDIKHSFLPRAVPIREITPRLTKHGTLNRSDFRFVKDGDLSYFNGGPFTLIEFEEFNPGSPKQIVERLNEAGWKPTEKTKGHLLALRENKQEKLAHFEVYGWTVSEENLKTLPDTAPAAAKNLAKRIMLASRQRTLTEWIEAYNPDTQRIHGSFLHIGAWTGRMSHLKPNTGNIAREDALYGSEMRSMWSSPEGSYLVGVDAESIQLRVLAHYINDPQFTQSLLTGKKEDGTDPHSLNKLALGNHCKSRNDAKTFIYAWLLGAGVGKVAQILGCDYRDAKQSVENFVEFYPGLKAVKRDQIPDDARRGYFQGFDGRWVKIWGEDQSSREHFCLAGYLQNGEVTVMKHAMKIWHPKLRSMGIPFSLVNFVHDEWQTQVPDCGERVDRVTLVENKNLKFIQDHSEVLHIEPLGEFLSNITIRVPKMALYVAEVKADAIRQAGEELGLRCPMAGSVLSGHGGFAIGKNWLETH